MMASGLSVTRVLNTLYAPFVCDNPDIRQYCNDAAAQGTIVHRMIEETLSIDNDLVYHMAVDDKAAAAHVEEPSLHIRTYSDQTRHARTWLSRRRGTVVGQEVVVSAVFDGNEMHGIIDAVITMPTRDKHGTRTRTVIVDWKTSRSHLGLARYVCQCELYALLYAEMHSIPLSDLRCAVVYVHTPAEHRKRGLFSKMSCIRKIRRSKEQLVAYLTEAS